MDEIKCLTCKFRQQNEKGRYECSALIDKAYERAYNGLYDCPFYKVKEANNGQRYHDIISGV